MTHFKAALMYILLRNKLHYYPSSIITHKNPSTTPFMMCNTCYSFSCSCYWYCLLTFSELTFERKYFKNTTRMSTGWIQIKTDVLSVLIWPPTVKLQRLSADDKNVGCCPYPLWFHMELVTGKLRRSLKMVNIEKTDTLCTLENAFSQA